MSGRKIESCYENPIDNLYIELAEKISPYFKKLGFTANGITGLSALFGLVSIHAMYQKKYTVSGLCYLIQYFFDCMDGNYARRYNQVSETGDKLDHYKDFTVLIGISFFFIIRKQWLGVFLLFGASSCIFHLGCQEIMYEKEESPTLSFTKKFTYCFDKDSAGRILPYSRWFGPGTWATLLSVYIMSLDQKKI